jgi:hypothetical protein
MAISEYQLVVQQAQKLSPQEQLQLIKQLAEQLAEREARPQQPRYLEYGKYRDTPGREFATEEDFKLAEWHPTEEELNGE